MTCASHCAQSFAPIGRQKAVRAHTALPPTVRGGATQAALTGTWLATHCEFGFVSALSSVKNGVAGPTTHAGEGRGASAPSARSPPYSNPRYVRCGRRTHRTHACIRRTPLQFDCSAFAADADGA
jgi:hypothetical protein